MKKLRIALSIMIMLGGACMFIITLMGVEIPKIASLLVGIGLIVFAGLILFLTQKENK